MDIEHVALNVPDPAAMAAWYVEHLQMRVLRRLAQAPFTHFIADRSGRGVLELYHHTRAALPDYAAYDPLVFHIAFRVEDVAAQRQRLIDAGARPAGDIVTTETGDIMTFLHDPWGVAVQLVKRQRPLI